MTDNFIIPDDLKAPFRRVIHQAPAKLHADSHFQQLTLLHLKVGGERLARHNTELFKLVLDEDKIFNRGLQSEEDREANHQLKNVDPEDGNESTTTDEKVDDGDGGAG